jgi:thiol-disulfide isomerase/thioredoxin
MKRNILIWGLALGLVILAIYTMKGYDKSTVNNTSDQKQQNTIVTDNIALQTPQKTESTTNAVEQTPQKSESTAKAVAQTPQKTDASAKAVEQTPQKTDASTKAVEQTPKKTEPTDKPIGNKITSKTSNNLAIDFTLLDFDGKNVSLKDFRGKNVLLNFWATWCPPCRGEMPDLEKIYQKYKGKDLVVLAVNLGENNDTVKSFIEKNNYEFKILLDTDQNIGNAYKITGIPTSYFIDKDGNIVNKMVGAMTLEQMEEYILALK